MPLGRRSCRGAVHATPVSVPRRHGIASPRPRFFSPSRCRHVMPAVGPLLAISSPAMSTYNVRLMRAASRCHKQRNVTCGNNVMGGTSCQPITTARWQATQHRKPAVFPAFSAGFTLGVAEQAKYVVRNYGESLEDFMTTFRFAAICAGVRPIGSKRSRIGHPTPPGVPPGCGLPHGAFLPRGATGGVATVTPPD
jgi:hypothetical protein